MPSSTHTKSKGCLQLSCLEPHSSNLLRCPSRKTMFHDSSYLAATPQPLWKKQDLYRTDSATAEVIPLLHPLISENLEASLNHREGMVQTICRKASFTLYRAAAHPCTIQQGKCYLLLFFYIYIYVHICTPHSSLQLSKGKSAALQKHE